MARLALKQLQLITTFAQQAITFNRKIMTPKTPNMDHCCGFATVDKQCNAYIFVVAIQIAWKTGSRFGCEKVYYKKSWAYNFTAASVWLVAGHTPKRNCCNKWREPAAHDWLFINVSVQLINSPLLDSTVLKIIRLEVSKQKITMYHFRNLWNILTSGQQVKFDKILSEVRLIVWRPRRP